MAMFLVQKERQTKEVKKVVMMLGFEAVFAITGLLAVGLFD